MDYQYVSSYVPSLKWIVSLYHHMHPPGRALSVCIIICIYQHVYNMSNISPCMFHIYIYIYMYLFTYIYIYNISLYIPTCEVILNYEVIVIQMKYWGGGIWG